MRKSQTISKILRIKDNKKRELEFEVKKANEEAEAEKAKLQTLQQEYMNIVKLFDDKRGRDSLSIKDVISFHDYLFAINEMIDTQKKTYYERIRKLETVKDNLVDAYKEKKLVEILNHNVSSKEKKEKAILEQKERDFFAISKRLR